MPENARTMNRRTHECSPVVSVLIITYNHEKFIAQALDSALMQQTDFDYEVVVGEDCSIDSTRSILRTYLTEWEPVVRVLFNHRNLGANRNLVNVLQECRGKYVAMLEGDDYWTSADKLQKQVNFLEAQSDCAVCFHDVDCVDESGRSVDEHRRESPHKSILSIEDLVRGNFIHTCSVMFIRGLVREFPSWFFDSKLGDWPLHLFNALHGSIGHIPEEMAAYRIHGEGVWSSSSEIDRLEETIRLYSLIDRHFDFRFNRIISEAESFFLSKLAVEHARDGNWGSAIRAAVEGVLKSPQSDRESKKWMMKSLLRMAVDSVFGH